MPYTHLLTQLQQLTQTSPTLESLQQQFVELIPAHLPYYNWTGFYMLESFLQPQSGDPEMLVLGPYKGAPTDHIRIPVSEGICGAAVAQNETVIIDDVHADPRYLACSIETKSEIVVPIHAAGAIIGEIDIDSHDPAAFTPQDRDFLEQAAKLIGAYVESKA